MALGKNNCLPDAFGCHISVSLINSEQSRHLSMVKQNSLKAFHGVKPAWSLCDNHYQICGSILFQGGWSRSWLKITVSVVPTFGQVWIVHLLYQTDNIYYSRRTVLVPSDQTSKCKYHTDTVVCRDERYLGFPGSPFLFLSWGKPNNSTNQSLSFFNSIQLSAGISSSYSPIPTECYYLVFLV